LLFIPTASNDSESYYNVVKKHFNDNLKCKTDVLYLIKNKYSNKELREKILKSDIIYVGGGNTKMMIRVWKKFGIDKILKEAYGKGIILSGISAGAICWFKFGNSDSLKFADKKAGMIKVSGLGIIKGIICPHYDVEKQRKTELKKMMQTIKGFALAFDNCSAIEIIDDKYRFIYSKKTANVYKVYWEKGKYYENKIIRSNKFLPLNSI
jgi:dipeptidase E